MIYLDGTYYLYSIKDDVLENGIDFGFFTNVWNPPAVGLDDWERAGITYLSFLTDKHGHIDDAGVLPVYYQARNTWDNNIPGWVFHGGERVVLAGKYEGIYPGVATRVMPDGTSYYEAFPFLVPKADGLSFAAMRPVRVVMDQWDRHGGITASGSLEALSESPGNTQVQVKAEKLIPGPGYRLMIDGDIIVEVTADKYGKILFTFTIERSREVEFRILKN